ncbi:hypothetical protein [Salinicola sp. CPA57]|uniref:hypothetical protein n=1 Tax=Salinicola sp. CPA57 TaxID=1949080 RepID=UPI000DA13632|nr:hypothetical protein [Salinicola sp. CPA57]
MVVFLLFAILLVLLIATGLLPGAMKVLSVFFVVLMVTFIGVTHGWLVVLGGGAVVLLIAAGSVFMAFRDIEKKHRIKEPPKVDIQKQLDRINAEQREKAARKEAAIRAQVEAVDKLER